MKAVATAMAMIFLRPFFWASTSSSLISIRMAAGAAGCGGSATATGAKASETGAEIGAAIGAAATADGRDPKGGAGMLGCIPTGGGIDAPAPLEIVFFPRRALRSILGFLFASSAIG